MTAAIIGGTLGLLAALLVISGFQYRLNRAKRRRGRRWL